MADSTSAPEGFSLKRWSRRKLEAAQSAPAATAPAAVAVVPPAAGVAMPAAAPAPPATGDAPALPPVESLTHDSDFSAFMQPKVDEGIKRAALKKLFTDPRFNVMDGLDIYVGDYTQPDPMPEGMLEKLGKVYAAVTHPEDAEAQTPTAAIAPETASAECPLMQTVIATNAPEENVTGAIEAADAATTSLPALEVQTGAAAKPLEPTAAIVPPALQPGKSQ